MDQACQPVLMRIICCLLLGVLSPLSLYPATISGNQAYPEHELLEYLSTRPWGEVDGELIPIGGDTTLSLSSEYEHRLHSRVSGCLQSDPPQAHQAACLPWVAKFVSI